MVDKLVICPACKQCQPGLVLRDGRIYAEMGSEVLGYCCPNCDKVVHWRVRDKKVKVVKVVRP